jgi:regulator of protease activity HflC (stomatin/prohibitin superfamily)
MENQNGNQKEILKNESENEAKRIREKGRKFLQELKAKGPSDANVGKTFIIPAIQQHDNLSDLEENP